MTRNLGHLNGNWKNGERASLDAVPFYLSPIDDLQAKLDAAHSLQGREEIPAANAERLIAEVQTRVWEMLAGLVDRAERKPA